MTAAPFIEHADLYSNLAPIERTTSARFRVLEAMIDALIAQAMVAGPLGYADINSRDGHNAYRFHACVALSKAARAYICTVTGEEPDPHEERDMDNEPATVGLVLGYFRDWLSERVETTNDSGWENEVARLVERLTKAADKLEAAPVRVGEAA